MNLRYLSVPIGFFIVFVISAFAPEHPVVCGIIFISIIIYGFALEDEESDLF